MEWLGACPHGRAGEIGERAERYHHAGAGLRGKR